MIQSSTKLPQIKAVPYKVKHTNRTTNLRNSK